MHITHTTKKGGKSHKKVKRKDYEATKAKAANEVINNLTAQARQIEANAIKHAIETHLGRQMAKEDAAMISTAGVKGKSGYVLVFDGQPLGRIERQHHKDKEAEQNYRVVYTPFE